MTPLQISSATVFAADIIETHAFRGDETAIIRPSSLKAVGKFLKETPELDFNFLMDLTAVDYLFFAGGSVSKRISVLKWCTISFLSNIVTASVSRFPVDEKLPRSRYA